MELKGLTKSGTAQIASAILNLARKVKMERGTLWYKIDKMQPGCRDLNNLTPANAFDLMIELANKLYKK